MVAHKDCGANRETLLKSCRLLVTFKLNYDFFICDTARKSYLQDRDAIYHQGLALIRGAFRISSVGRLYTETHEIFLTLRRQKFALQYYTKVHSCPNNHVFNSVFQKQYKYLFNKNIAKHKNIYQTFLPL